MIGRLALRFTVLLYLAAILLVPVGLVFWRTFEHGIGPAWDAVTTPKQRGKATHPVLTSTAKRGSRRALLSGARGW